VGPDDSERGRWPDGNCGRGQGRCEQADELGVGCWCRRMAARLGGTPGGGEGGRCARSGVIPQF
jgi:hypothetical protein